MKTNTGGKRINLLAFESRTNKQNVIFIHFIEDEKNYPIFFIIKPGGSGRKPGQVNIGNNGQKFSAKISQQKLFKMWQIKKIVVEASETGFQAGFFYGKK